MNGKFDNSRGNVRVANRVIAKIVGYTATGCYGVVGMALSGGKDGIAKLLKLEQMDRGVKIRMTDDGIEIALFIIVEYGTNISAIGEVIRSSVKYHVEDMTGLNVARVDVNVEGIRVN
ncbi:MAG TPA: Asp23/Gls24 family envelope stress response protein [Candidatus Monoglobus merdigallinarum]|uniref:Asp23/Gls24 family envelope stress response protein n=1 Tax=Candidatus Monoglobus merdigallinarum TaxID=2838698 RepID=A0A9D1PR19_9FIRM|nr:Asp23/Gls24 family envelope stress response protein [Candidatus Monoglobus merdigallinarum]